MKIILSRARVVISALRLASIVCEVICFQYHYQFFLATHRVTKIEILRPSQPFGFIKSRHHNPLHHLSSILDFSLNRFHYLTCKWIRSRRLLNAFRNRSLPCSLTRMSKRMPLRQLRSCCNYCREGSTNILWIVSLFIPTFKHAFIFACFCK